MEKFTTHEVQELLKNYFEPEIITQGIMHYLKVEREAIEISEEEKNYNYYYSFTIPIDKHVYLQITYRAGLMTGVRMDNYNEYLSINGIAFVKPYKIPNNPTDSYFYENKIFNAYNPHFKNFFTFLYFEFEKLMLEIQSKGFSNVTNNFTGDGYKLVRDQYDPSKTTWLEFLETKRQKYNPNKENTTKTDNKVSLNKTAPFEPTTNSGCLIFIITGISILFSVYSHL